MDMSSGARRKAILVLGIGNILLGDEGLGVCAIEYMQAMAAGEDVEAIESDAFGMELREDVEFLDGGTGGADLLDIICDRRKVIVIDAIAAGLEPGSILRLTDDDLEVSPVGIRSLHDFGLVETLAMAKRLGCAPEEVVIVGVEPEDLSVGIGVSERISSVMPGIVDAVLREVVTVKRV
jgi:hydrogenase maturation protease